MTPEQRRKAEQEYGPTPANRAQIEEICRLIPEREKEVWQLVYAKPHYLTDEQARAILAVARKPKIAPTKAGEAERLHAQSAEVLAQRQADELLRMRERDYRFSSRRAGGAMRGDREEDLRQRYQQIIDYWHERKLADAEYEQRFREDAIERYDNEVIWRGYR